jgi:hypothetical protein
MKRSIRLQRPCLSALLVVAIACTAAGCVRYGFDPRSDAGNNGKTAGDSRQPVLDDSGQPVFIDSGQPAPGDGGLPVPDDSGGATAPQGCDPALGWQTCGWPHDCYCSSGTCYFWCPASAISCRFVCSNGATCNIHCDARCDADCSGNAICTICRLAGGSHHCFNATCNTQCPTEGCS